jgi:predicted aminopeptidase
VSLGQLSIMLAQRPIAEVLHGTSLPASDREKLALVPLIKRYGVERLGLKGDRNYESFVRLDRSYTTLVLSAAPADSLTPFKWSFPIVGAVPYKGFFDPKPAEAEKAALAALGYDVYLRPASAFSTLGWFNDPILSPMLAFDEADLANTILHEMTHATLYFADHAEFNETAATFVGNQAEIAYLTARYGPGATEVTAALADIDDQRRFAAFVRATLEGLKPVYATGTRDEKLKAKERYFAERKAAFRAGLGAFHVPAAYAKFPDLPWNNASLLARDAYFGDLDLFARLYAKRKQPLRDFVTYLQGWRHEADPRERLRREAASN